MHGLLWTAVKRDELEVSRATERALATEFMRTKARHERFWETYEQISKKLGDEGIDFAAIKGVTREKRWYDAPGERPSRDVDMWLSPHQSNGVAEVIRILTPDHSLLNKADQIGSGKYLQALPLAVGGETVDVHIDLFAMGLRTKSALSIWNETRVEDFHGQRIRVLDEVAALALTLVQLNRDSFHDLLPVCDLGRITGQCPGSLADAIELLSLDGLRDHGIMTLQAIRADLEIAQPCDSPELPSAGKWLWEAIWPPPTRFRSGSPFRYRFRRSAGMALSARGRKVEAVKYLARRAFPPDWIFHHRRMASGGPYVWRAIANRARAIRRMRDSPDDGH